MRHVFESDHPLVRYHLTQLRDKNTSPGEFRALMRKLSYLLGYEATRDLAVRDRSIQTPMTSMAGSELAARIAIVPILRAGLGMVDPLLELIPEAEVWHLGLYRDEATAQPVRYYNKLPQTDPADVAIVLDPMLATGGSASVAIECLREWGVRSIKLISVIASQEGVDVVVTRFPDTQIFLGAIDPELDAVKYIVPGLGDAGDRTFNTLRCHE